MAALIRRLASGQGLAPALLLLGLLLIILVLMGGATTDPAHFGQIWAISEPAPQSPSWVRLSEMRRLFFRHTF